VWDEENKRRERDSGRFAREISVKERKELVLPEERGTIFYMLFGIGMARGSDKIASPGWVRSAVRGTRAGLRSGKGSVSDVFES